METEDFIIVERKDGEPPVEITPKDLERIRNWLSPTNFEAEGSEYHKHLNARVNGTGDWLLHTEQYQKWHEADRGAVGALWIQGIPGSGKSVVAANLVETLRKESAPVALFFARRIIKSNSEPRHLVRDCLYQLLDHGVNVQEKLKETLQKYSDVDEVPFQDLWRVFRLGLAALPTVYVVFDALDELAVEKDNFLPLLVELGRSTKLIMTSRPEAHLQQRLTHPSTAVIRLTNRLVGEDIATYVTHRLNEQTVKDLSAINRDELKEVLCQKSRGLFLYARLMLDEILQQSTAPIQLDSLPGSLEDMYVDLLHENSARSGASQHFQHLLLTWVTHASRPLRVTELAAMVDSDADRCGLGSTQDAKLMVRTACGPLLEILDDETVQIIHHSFTECLLDASRSTATAGCSGDSRWFPAIVPNTAHGVLASRCIDYLSAGCFESWEGDDDWDYDEGFDHSHMARMAQFPFMQYALQHVLYHAAKYDCRDSGLIQKFDLFFKDDNPDFETWKDFWSASNKVHKTPELHPLHIAAQAGLTVYTNHLLKRGHSHDLADANGRTAVTYACMNGQAATLAALIAHGGSCTVEDRYGLAPIHHAAKGNHLDALQCLLSAGADAMQPQAKSPYGGAGIAVGKTALEYACELGNTEIVSVLLDRLTPDIKRLVLPHWAAVNGRVEALSVLLSHPEIVDNINAKDRGENTALFLAAYGSFSETVRLLLQHGADVHIKSAGLDGRGNPLVASERRSDSVYFGPWTPLQGWAKSQWLTSNTSVDDFEQTGALLIASGSDVEARDRHGRTVLFSWGEVGGRFWDQDRGKVRFVSLLLKSGANPRATDHNGYTPLHAMSRPPSAEAIRALVAAGADINHGQGDDLVTPLILLAKGQWMNVTALIENGADPNLQDCDGNTALHHICKSWCLEERHVQQWLTFADPTIKNKAGETCIYNLREGNGGETRVASLPLFVEKGLDLESRDRRGRTALLAACSNGEPAFIVGLLQNGANAGARDFENKNCLHLIAGAGYWHNRGKPQQGWANIFQQLISTGLSVTSTDNGGNTPFHDALASASDYKGKAKAILDCGGVANTRNHHGHTALHKVAALKESLKHNVYGIFERMKFLLQPKMGIDIHARDNEGLMSIHYIAQTSLEDTWKLLLAGADITAKSDDGKGVLHYAAKGGQSNTVGLLCKLYGERSLPVDQKDEEGRTPLHYAALVGSPESVMYLLSHGADPDAQDNAGRTPLHSSVEYQAPAWDARYRPKKYDSIPSELSKGLFVRLVSLDQFVDWEQLGYWAKNNRAPEHTLEPAMIQDVVRLLVHAGSNPCIRDKSKQTAYDLAVLLKQEEVINVLLTLHQGAGEELSWVEQWFASRSAGDHKVPHERRVEPKDSYAQLQTAIILGSQALLSSLLTAGADPNIPGPDGLTPVHYVAHLGCMSMMESLIPYIKDWNAFKPPLLNVAASRQESNLAMVRLLIKQGVDLNAVFQECKARNDHSTTPPASYSAVHILAIGEYWWHTAALESLCEAGVDLELQNKSGNTALRCALNGMRCERRFCALWRDETLDVILRYGAKLNTDDEYKPFDVALRGGRGAKVIKKLLEHGADITARAIIDAVKRRDCEVVAAVLDAGAVTNTEYRPENPMRNGTGPQVETPLLVGAVHDSNWFDEKNNKTNEAVMSLLLERGADPLQELSDAGTTVFHEICQHSGTIGPILSKGGIDLDVVDSKGCTPLHYACWPKGRYKDTTAAGPSQQLIRAGANIHARNADQSTPLHLAVQSGLRDTVALLLEHGASMSVVDNKGASPLYYALSEHYSSPKHIQLINTLLSAGGLLDLSSPDNSTPLHFLAPFLMILPLENKKESQELQREYQAVYERFIEAGWDRNAKDNNGNTPLFLYVRKVKGRSDYINIPAPEENEVRKMFSDHDIFAVNHNGDTLLHAIAARQEDREGGGTAGDGLMLFEILLEMGLDPKQENKKGLSALDVAAAYGKEQILALFARED